MRSLSGWTAVLALAAVAHGQAPPTFQAGVEVVRLDVTAVDHDGRPVTDLSAADFEVTEKGHPREILGFETVVVKAAVSGGEPAKPATYSAPASLEPDDGRYFLLFFDDTHISPLVSQQVREQLLPLLQREVRDGDWVSVVAPEERVWWTARTPWEHRRLPALIQRLSGQFQRDPVGNGAQCQDAGGGMKRLGGASLDYNAMRVVEYGSRTGADTASRGGGGVLQEAGRSDWLYCQLQYDDAQRRIRQSLALLEQAVSSMGGWRGRKSLFLFSEGFIRAPGLRELYDRVIAAARKNSVTVYFVAAQGLREDCANQMCLEAEAGGASYIATETGGRSFLTNAVASPVQEVLEASSAYYLLGIRPLDEKPGEHQVRVRVRRRGVRVVARSRYFVAPSSASSHELPASLRALRAAFDATAIAIRVSVRVEGATPSGRRRVGLVIDLPPPSGKADERRLSVLVECHRLQGGTPAEYAGEVTLRAAGAPQILRYVEFEPGTWQARVVVADTQSGALGSALHTFEVPALEVRP